MKKILILICLCVYVQMIFAQSIPKQAEADVRIDELNKTVERLQWELEKTQKEYNGIVKTYEEKYQSLENEYQKYQTVSSHTINWIIGIGSILFGAVFVLITVFGGIVPLFSNDRMRKETDKKLDAINKKMLQQNDSIKEIEHMKETVEILKSNVEQSAKTVALTKLLVEVLQKNDPKFKIELYKKIITLDQNIDYIYTNWGFSLYELAEQKIGEVKEEILNESISKYKKTIELNSDYYLAYYNWGMSLNDLAKLKIGDEKEKLFRECILKYKKAIDLKPDDYETRSALGIALYHLAKIKTGEEKEKLFKEAETELKYVFEYDDRNYNLACLYAAWGKEGDALGNLHVALSNNENTKKFVMNDEDWNDYKNHTDFKELLK